MEPFIREDEAEVVNDVFVEAMVSAFDEGIATRNLYKCEAAIKELRDRGFETAADRLQAELSNKRLYAD